MASLSNNRVVVVGGSSGIGAACVEHLAQNDNEVLVIDLREPVERSYASNIALADVRAQNDLQTAVTTLAHGRPIDGLVYAAGTGGVAPFEAIALKQWRLVLGVNLEGAFFAAQAAIPYMRSGSAFVFISSIDSEVPVSGLAHYCVSKAGLEALSRAIALELAPRGIRSNVVAPGPVRTPLMNGILADRTSEDAFIERTPLGAIGEPRQIAEAVAFLLSPASQHMTGARLVVDGGMSLREHPSMLTHTKGHHEHRIDRQA